jgi:hypothetical protein
MSGERMSVRSECDSLIPLIIFFEQVQIVAD